MLPRDDQKEGVRLSSIDSLGAMALARKNECTFLFGKFRFEQTLSQQVAESLNFDSMSFNLLFPVE